MSNEKNQEIGDDQKANVSAYLQSPRKKRKNFVLIAVRQGFDRVAVQYMEQYIKANHSALATAKPTTLNDLRRQLNRSISLLILDDEFAPLPEMLEVLKKVRDNRRRDTIPVLFLTRNANALIEAYHRTVGVYQEIDDLVEYVNIERTQLIGRIKVGIERKNRRRSRRFTVRTDVTYYLLRRDCHLKGRLLDLSMHGATLEATEGELFKVGDQLKLMIPGNQYVDFRTGEFLRISAKVRRVFINGFTAGISFEYVSESQNTILTKIITGIMSEAISTS